MGKFLPQEIITEILARLPNDSLWECKLVCKPWQDIIVYDPSFTHMHIRHRLHGTYSDHGSSDKVSFIFQLLLLELIVVVKDYYAEFDKSNATLIRSKNLDVTHRDAYNDIDDDTLPSTPWSGSYEGIYYEKIVGSCNGLICITLSSDVINEVFYKPLYVCNPMTRECVVLPLIIDGPCYQNDVEEWEGINCDGFGYSPSMNEYKVIRIYKDEVYVYTLGDDKGWRNIGTKEHKSGIGKYIHSAYNQLDKDRNLVSFDLEDEKFGVLLSPPCFRDWKDYSYKLMEIGERLSIVHENHDVYDIWLLKNKNEKGYQSWTWIKEYTLNDDRDASQKFNDGIPNPFAITKDREVLFNNDRFFYRHDLNTSTSDPLVGLKKCIPWYICKVVHHVNSFVSLKALGERDATTTMENIVVDKCLAPELTYNIEEEEKTIFSDKTKERTDELE